MLQGLNVLVVEDQMIIALDCETGLYENGVARVEIASSTEQALALLQNFRPDVAILDIVLDKDTSIPLAQKLLISGIPFVFTTGYDDPELLPPELKCKPILPKPYEISVLTETVRLLAERRGGPCARPVESLAGTETVAD